MRSNNKFPLIYGVLIAVAGVGCAAIVHHVTHQEMPNQKKGEVSAPSRDMKPEPIQQANSSHRVASRNVKRLASISETSLPEEYFSKSAEGSALHQALELRSRGILDKISLDNVRQKMRDNPHSFFKEIQQGLNRIPLDGHDLERELLIQWAAQIKTDIKSRMKLLELELSYVITRDLNAKGKNYPTSSLVAFDAMMTITPSKQEIQRRLLDTIITLPSDSAATTALIARYAAKDPVGAAHLKRNLPGLIKEATKTGHATKAVENFLDQVDAEAGQKYRQIARASDHNGK